MQRIEIRTDRLNTPETVAEYLGLTKDTVIRMARGRKGVKEPEIALHASGQVFRYKQGPGKEMS